MATQYEVDCMRKTNGTAAHDVISHIGGPNNGSGLRWIERVAKAIEMIEQGQWQLWVRVNGQAVWVVVATSAGGHKYLRTQADATTVNNLLSLKSCPT